jgi:hypothetical protein
MLFRFGRQGSASPSAVAGAGSAMTNEGAKYCAV